MSFHTKILLVAKMWTTGWSLVISIHGSCRHCTWVKSHSRAWTVWNGMNWWRTVQWRKICRWKVVWRQSIWCKSCNMRILRYRMTSNHRRRPAKRTWYSTWTVVAVWRHRRWCGWWVRRWRHMTEKRRRFWRTSCGRTQRWSKRSRRKRRRRIVKWRVGKTTRINHAVLVERRQWIAMKVGRVLISIVIGLLVIPLRHFLR